MLHILWMLLKIIGIILLVILGLLILSVCVVLFIPLKYRGEAECFGTIDSIKAQLKFSWLLHLISGYVHFENQETKWQIRILWKKLNVEKKKIPEKAKPKKHEKPEDVCVDGPSKEAEGDFEEKELISEKDSHEKSAKESRKQKKSPAKVTILEKIKYTFRKICDKIKMLIKKKEKLQAFLADELHRSAWKRLKQEIWRLLKFLRPKKLILNLHFGFEDPATTGKVLAVLCILYPFYLKHINLEPEFEKVILEGNAYIKGNIKGLHLLIVICNLFFDRNIKVTYKDIKNWRS